MLRTVAERSFNGKSEPAGYASTSKTPALQAAQSAFSGLDRFIDRLIRKIEKIATNSAS